MSILVAPFESRGSLQDDPILKEDIMSEQAKKSLPWWAWVLIGLGVLLVIGLGIWGISSASRARSARAEAANAAVVPVIQTYETVTLVVQTPKNVLRRFVGYDGKVADGEQVLDIDDQSDNRLVGSFEIPNVATGYDVVLNAVVDMGPGTKRGWLSDPRNVPSVTIVVKETGKKLSISESDIVSRRTGGSKAATRILRFLVTAEGEPISARPSQPETSVSTGGSMGSPPPVKK